MVVAGQIKAILDAETSRFERNLRKAFGELDKGQKIAKRAEGRLGKLAGKLGKLETALAGVASAGAAFGAIAKGFQLAEAAQGAKTATQVFTAMGGSLRELRDATMGMISDAELVKKANLAQTMGINAKAFQNLAQISLASAAKTGQSVSFLFDSIITGTARQSKMILDNLGILVSVKKANQDYAKSIGTTATALTDAQKKQAFMNAVMNDGATILDELKQSGIDVSNPFARFSATVDNMGQLVGDLLIPAFNQLLDILEPATSFVLDLGDKFRNLKPEIQTIIGRVGAFVIAATALVGALGAGAGLLGTLVLLAPALKAIALAALPVIVILLKIALVAAAVAAVAGLIRVAWERNADSIKRAWSSVVDFFGRAVDKISEFAKKGLDFMQDAWGTVIKAVLNLIALIPRLWMKAIKTVLEGIDSLLGKTADVARAFGQEGLAESAESARKSIKGAAGAVGGMEESLKGAIDKAEDLLNPVKNFKRLVGAGGGVLDKALEFGGAIATKAGEILRETGALIGEGWALILKDIGIDINDLWANDPPRAIKKALADGGSELSDEILKAIQKFRDRLEEFRSRELVGTAPFQGIAQAAEDFRKELRENAKAASKFGGDLTEMNDLSRRAAARSIASEVNAAKSMDEFNKKLEFARLEAERVGISFGLVAENLRAEPEDFSAIVEGAVGMIFDSVVSSFDDFEIPDEDRSAIVAAISDAIAAMLEDGELDFKSISKAIGQLIGAADFGGGGGAGASGPQVPVGDLAEAAQGVQGAGTAAKAVGGATKGAGTAAGGKGIIGALMGAGSGAGASGGIIGVVIGAAVAAVIAVLAQVIIQGAQQVASAIAGFANGLANLAGDARLKDAVKAAFNPLVLAIGGIATILAPLAPLIGAVLLGMAMTFAAIAIAISPLVPVIIFLAAVIGGLIAIIGVLVAVINFVLGVIGLIAAVLVALVITVVLVIVVLFLLVTNLWMVVAVLAVIAAAGVGLAVAIASVVAGLMAFMAFLAIATKTDSFKKFQLGFEAVTDRLVEATEPFFESLFPLIGLFDAFVNVLLPVFDAFTNIGAAGPVLFEAFRALALGVSVLLFVFAVLANGVLAVTAALAQAAAWALDLAGQTEAAENVRIFGQSALDMSPNLNEMAEAIAALAGLTFQEADQRARELIARKENEKEINESLTNIPAGFKVAAARFRAITPGLGANEPTGGDDDARAAPKNFFIDTILLSSDDPDKFAGDLEAEAETNSFQQTGTTGTSDGQNNGS